MKIGGAVPKTQVNVRLPATLYERAVEYCRRNETTITHVAVVSISSFLDEKEKEKEEGNEERKVR